MSKEYTIGFHYSEFAKISVKANSQTEAEAIVYKMLDDYGMPEDCKIFDRDYSVDYGEEVKTMSKDYREQSQLEDEADEKYLTMYQYYKQLTDFERGEYDALHSYPFDESEESNKDYTEGYRTGYEYAQQIGANSNEQI